MGDVSFASPIFFIALCGELACGTGACATAVACVLNGKTDDEVTVKLLGGDLIIRFDRENNKVYMTGPARVVFDGETDRF